MHRSFASIPRPRLLRSCSLPWRRSRVLVIRKQEPIGDLYSGPAEPRHRAHSGVSGPQRRGGSCAPAKRQRQPATEAGARRDDPSLRCSLATVYAPWFPCDRRRTLRRPRCRDISRPGQRDEARVPTFQRREIECLRHSVDSLIAEGLAPLDQAARAAPNEFYSITRCVPLRTCHARRRGSPTVARHSPGISQARLFGPVHAQQLREGPRVRIPSPSGSVSLSGPET